MKTSHVLSLLSLLFVTSTPAWAMGLVYVDRDGPKDLKIRFTVQDPIGVDYGIVLAYGTGESRVVEGTLAKKSKYTSVHEFNARELMPESGGGIVSYDLRSKSAQAYDSGLDGTLVLEILQGNEVIYREPILTWYETRRGTVSEYDPPNYRHSGDFLIEYR